MQTVGPALCSSCLRLSKDLNPALGIPTTCEAYPDGIPAAYLTGSQPHIEPDGQDGGLVYLRNPEKDASYNDYVQFHPELRP